MAPVKRIGIVSLALIAACGGRVALPSDAHGGRYDASDSGSGPPIDAGRADAAIDGRAADSSLGADGTSASASGALPSQCADAGVPPATLECTGLYANFATQTLSPSAKPYAPAVPLWSDGATKERWIELPSGKQIDASNPNEWVFPVGTKLFKQFTYEGKRVETRMFQKTATNFWVHATYAWNADDTAAAISYGATVPVGTDGGTWVIPSSDDCDSCHRGRSDRILGFEQVSLGLQGATGLTLLQLVVQGLVTPPPTQVNLRIGDDGTGLDGPALSWLHVNCGVTCHNANENAQGYGAGMRLRLDPTLLDGTPASASWDPLQTTLGVPCVSGSVQGQPRIVPGDSSASVIVQLTTQRGILQMPPIASRFVDTADVATVIAWIQHLPQADAGTSGGQVDAEPGLTEDSGDDAQSSTNEAENSPDATVANSGDDGGTFYDGPSLVDEAGAE